MGKFALVVIGVALFVYTLFDLVATPRERVRYVPKPLWFVILLVPGLGPLLWILLGRERTGRNPPRPRRSPPPPGPRGPDDDPDYLRNL
jgi:hypothetical protein